MIAICRIKAFHTAAEVVQASSSTVPKCVKQTRASLNAFLNGAPLTLSGVLPRTTLAHSSV